jgi:hypothetical protein
MKKAIWCIGMLTFGTSVIAQRLPINVSPFTGTASVTIPIENVIEGDISVPVGISYVSNGIRLKDGEGTAGLGWNLVAGRQISRTVRGLPDDNKKDLGNYNKIGWLYNTHRSAITAFNIANNSDPVNCTNAQSDINYINTNFNYNEDTEPDIFQIGAPGLSCQFVFDNNNTILPIPYQDLVITPTYDAASGRITSFTVTNDRGIKYTFAGATTATRKTTTQAGPGGGYWNEDNVNILKAPIINIETG